MTRATGDRNGQFEAQESLGRCHHATGHHQGALACHHSALTLAAGLGYPSDLARAHDGLAHAHHALDHHERARLHWQSALTILTANGLDHTSDPQVSAAAIRTRLADLDQQQRGTER
jgi:hypothetical protein